MVNQPTAHTISFIVIGRNEGEKLRRCFKSIYHAIALNALKDHEIIYVDSKSVDHSIEIARSFREIRIFSITGACNAAIARNIGAHEATGDTFFFIDGDMEISASFLTLVFDQKKQIKYPLVTGQIVDVMDDFENYTRITDKLPFLSSGVFIIRKELWVTVNGMKTKYITGEDVNLGLRLIRQGFPITHKPEVITKHFTVPYFHKSRIWKSMWNRSYFHSRCVLYRDLLWNKSMYEYLFLIDKTFILFVFMLIGCILFPSYFPIFIAVYFIVVSFRSMKQQKHMSVAEYVLFYTVSDVLNFIYFFTLFPRAKKMKYAQVGSAPVVENQKKAVDS